MSPRARAVGRALAAAALLAGAATAQERNGSFTLALTGDSLITRRLSVHDEPAFLRMIELIRSADGAFTNLEMLFHDYEPYPMTESGGTYLRGEPALAKELAWSGFDMVSRANNHAGDYGPLGMRLTTRHVAEAGLVQAGVGESLAEAREARFLETAKARVALVSVASTFPDFARAGKTRGDVPPRPGLSPLRFTTTYLVPRPRLSALRELARELGLNPPAEGDELTVFRARFRAAEKADVETEPDPEDVAEIAAVVRNASRLADCTVVSIHAHEGDRDVFVPARFLVRFAHAMIDAGADVLVGHGPHVLRGIEVYKGRPILYSLGNFIFENETVLRLPYENYEAYGLGADQHVADFNDRRYDNDRRGFPSRREMWESVIALPRWQGRTLVELRLVPISLGFGRPRQVRGRPLLAEADLARRIIDDLARLSAPFGTRLEYHEGTAVVRLQ